MTIMAICALPHDMSTSLVKHQVVWRLLELARTAHLDVDDNAARHVTRVDVREKRMTTSTAIQASTFIASLSTRGMEVDDAPIAIMAVAAGALARKVSERGIAPLLMKLARSPLEEVSTDAERIGQNVASKELSQMIAATTG